MIASSTSPAYAMHSVDIDEDWLEGRADEAATAPVSRDPHVCGDADAERCHACHHERHGVILPGLRTPARQPRAREGKIVALESSVLLQAPRWVGRLGDTRGGPLRR